MTPEERQAGRKAILEDVKLLLSDSKIKAAFGHYFVVEVEIEELLMRHYEQDLRDVIQDESFSCEVCAIGAVFMGYVSRFDEVMVKPYYNSYTMIQKVTPYFTEEEMNLFEAAFEGHWDEEREWLDEYAIINDPEDRLLAIINYVLEHGSLEAGR